MLNPEEAQKFRNAGRKAIHERIEKRKECILEKARTEGKITNDGVEDMFCIGDGTAANYLKQLTEEGKLKREGVGRGVRYTPV